MCCVLLSMFDVRTLSKTHCSEIITVFVVAAVGKILTDINYLLFVADSISSHCWVLFACGNTFKFERKKRSPLLLLLNSRASFGLIFLDSAINRGISPSSCIRSFLKRLIVVFEPGHF